MKGCGGCNRRCRADGRPRRQLALPLLGVVLIRQPAQLWCRRVKGCGRRNRRCRVDGRPSCQLALPLLGVVLTRQQAHV